MIFGGAAGGGKSDAILMAASAYVHVPGYAALILRKTYADLSLPEAIMDRAKTWWHGKVSWSESAKTFTFPSGATITFGYLESKGDKYRYQGAEFQFVGFDELTQFEEDQYEYLFSRLRKKKARMEEVPLRMRAATNPGGVGHDWVKRRFISDEFLAATDEEKYSRVWQKGGAWFVPARLEDNQHLDLHSYEKSLGRLDAVTRNQLRHGDWKAHSGGRFKSEWFRTYRDNGDSYKLMDTGELLLKRHMPRVVTLDPANRQTKSSKYTAMGCFGDAGMQRVLVLDMVREQLTLESIIPRLDLFCERWRPSWAGIEANGFQLALCNEARDRGRHRNIPTVIELQPEGRSKLTRATPAILRAEHGRIYLPEDAPWLNSFLGELCQFTGDEKLDTYSDQVDVLAYAVLGIDIYATGDDTPGAGATRGRR